MQTRQQPLSVRSLIETTGLPFMTARYPPRATLFNQGDESDSVMHIEGGQVELSALASNGRTAICGVLGAGDFVGEEVLAGCLQRPYSATAMTRTEVLTISRPIMMQLLGTEPKFAGRFIAHSVNRTTRLRADLADQLLCSCEERLVHVLMTLADADAGDSGRYTLPRVTQEFIARMVGTTRSRVNHFLGKFKKIGFVEEHDGILNINPAVLLAATGGAADDAWSLPGLQGGR